VIGHFFTSGLLEEKDLPSLVAGIRKVVRLRESVLAEGVMVGLVILGAVFLRREFSEGFSTWENLVSSGGVERTLAGWWFLLISLPIFQFLMIRWVWRIGIWYWFLWHTSKLDLRLIPTRPDMAGGLGILSLAQAKFGIIIFAASAMIAAEIGRDIIFGAASLFDYQMFVLGYVLLILVLFLIPLFVFEPETFCSQEKRTSGVRGIGQPVYAVVPQEMGAGPNVGRRSPPRQFRYSIPGRPQEQL
jgi:hypothetical protein